VIRICALSFSVKESTTSAVNETANPHEVGVPHAQMFTTGIQMADGTMQWEQLSVSVEFMLLYSCRKILTDNNRSRKQDR